jgi:NAD(P)-dependent dehydrogenase (short-subunit alcohol dehydrogenase family)
MILKDKIIVIYGAGGSLGAAIAKAFAKEGAHLFLTGRTLSNVQKVADEITASGGAVQVDEVDAMDEGAVAQHLEKVVKDFGGVDVSFNLIDLQVVQNLPLVDMTVDDFTRPGNIALRSHFITATQTGRMMIKQGSGVILSLTATPGGIGYPFTAGFAPACAAIESFYRNLAAELGIYGIRTVNIRSGGSPDSKVFSDAIKANPEGMKTVLQTMENDTMLKTMPLTADIANTAAFLASDLAGKITGVTVDVTCGTTAGLNYRAGGDKALRSRRIV